MTIDEITPGLHVLNAYFGSVVVDSLLIVTSIVGFCNISDPLVGFCNFSMFCCAILCVHSSFSIISKTFKLFVAFPWVETSTGPGGFIICVFII